jgi:chromosomal replication initiation ATPase DnaA
MEARLEREAQAELARLEAIRTTPDRERERMEREAEFIQKSNQEFRDALARAKDRTREDRLPTAVHGAHTMAASIVKSAAHRVSKAYGVSIELLMGNSRSVPVATARAHLMVLLCIENEGHTIISIARALGRDHTTMLWALTSYNRHFGTSHRTSSLRCKPRVMARPWKEVEPA